MNGIAHRTPGPTLVLGATGKTGRRVAARLNQLGHPVRLGSRAAEPAFDWGDPETWTDVLRDVTAMYISYPSDLPIEPSIERISALLWAARSQQVEHVVLLSGRGEEACLQWEEAARESGISWTIVRSAWFNQNFSEGGFADMVRDGALVVSNGQVPEPFVDLDDVADVVVAALTEPGHAGQTYEVTGPRLLTFEQIASALSDGLGRTVDYVSLPRSELLASVAEHGGSEDEVALVDYLFGTLLDGRNARLGDGVRRVLGREPKAFRAYVEEMVSSDVWEVEPVGEDSTEGQEAQALVRRLIEEVINGQDYTVLREVLHDDYVYRAPGEELRGPESLEALFSGYREAFPDLEVRIDDAFGSGSQVATSFTLTGTHTGPLMELPATGRSVSVAGIVHSRVKGGRIVDEWELIDTAALMQQLGVGEEG